MAEGWYRRVRRLRLQRKVETPQRRFKEWNKDHFGHIKNKIMSLRDEIQLLDECDDVEGLTDEGTTRRREATALLILYMNNRRNFLAQKARIRLAP